MKKLAFRIVNILLLLHWIFFLVIIRRKSRDLYIWDFDNTLSDTNKAILDLKLQEHAIPIELLKPIDHTVLNYSNQVANVVLTARGIKSLISLKKWFSKNRLQNPELIATVSYPEAKKIFLKVAGKIFPQVMFIDDLSFLSKNKEIIGYKDLIIHHKSSRYYIWIHPKDL